jgi:hypothetical protein
MINIFSKEVVSMWPTQTIMRYEIAEIYRAAKKKGIKQCGSYICIQHAWKSLNKRRRTSVFLVKEGYIDGLHWLLPGPVWAYAPFLKFRYFHSFLSFWTNLVR